MSVSQNFRNVRPLRLSTASTCRSSVPVQQLTDGHATRSGGAIARTRQTHIGALCQHRHQTNRTDLKHLYTLRQINTAMNSASLIAPQFQSTQKTKEIRCSTPVHLGHLCAGSPTMSSGQTPHRSEQCRRAATECHSVPQSRESTTYSTDHDIGVTEGQTHHPQQFRLTCPVLELK